MKLSAFVFALMFSAAMSLLADSENHSTVLVSIPDQEMILFRNGQMVASYPVSTSRFGVGDRPGSYRTPLGVFEIARKIGAGLPVGMVFKGRQPTGEIVKAGARGRDPIVTRILWLDGLEAQNVNAFSRAIYIHGTPQETLIGQPASYGCIRMRSKDIVRLYRVVTEGTRVHVLNVPVARIMRRLATNQRGNRTAS